MNEHQHALRPLYLGRVDYLPTYAAMQDFTSQRSLQGTPGMPDQLWICEHFPVYTQGLAGKAEHLLNPGTIPVVQTNRGGQVTYHGLGQVVAYPLLDLRRAGYFVKEYVDRLEEALIATLQHFGVTGHRVAGAPGIYVRLDGPDLKVSDVEKCQTFKGLGKIAALGLKVSRHCTYHGVALNVAMNLEPYSRINPCGYAGLQTIDLSTIGVFVAWQEVADILAHQLFIHLLPRSFWPHTTQNHPIS